MMCYVLTHQYVLLYCALKLIFINIFSKGPAGKVFPLATKSLMLEFCFTHPDSIRMLFPEGNKVPIQSTSGPPMNNKRQR